MVWLSCCYIGGRVHAYFSCFSPLLLLRWLRASDWANRILPLKYLFILCTCLRFLHVCIFFRILPRLLSKLTAAAWCAHCTVASASDLRVAAWLLCVRHMPVVDRHATAAHLVGIAALMVQSAACRACHARMQVRTSALCVVLHCFAGSQALSSIVRYETVSVSLCLHCFRFICSAMHIAS